METRAWVQENDCRKVDINCLQLQIDELRLAVALMQKEVDRLTKLTVNHEVRQEFAVEPV